MGNFDEIVPRRLNITPARVATLAEAQNAPVPFDKYYTLKTTRVIQKLDTYFVLPATTVPIANVRIIGDYLFQFNATAPQPFYILNPIRENNGLTSIVTVKWRVGTTVYRYFIEGEQLFKVFGIYANINSFLPYTGQLIPVQCVFEVWCGALNNINPVNVGLLTPYKVKTSLKIDPATPSDIESDLVVKGPFFRETTAFPLTLPLNNPWPDTIWNSN